MDIMNETLPITIQVSEDLIDEIKNISAISNKLAAQLNFHTMSANWYGEETKILQISFTLLALSEFNLLAADQQNSLKQEYLADDVLMSSVSKQVHDCYVAITASELLLLQQTPKILSGYLAKKLTKVLNLIANRQGLTNI